MSVAGGEFTQTMPAKGHFLPNADERTEWGDGIQG